MDRGGIGIHIRDEEEKKIKEERKLILDIYLL